VDKFVDKNDFDPVTLDAYWCRDFCSNFMQSLLLIKINDLQSFKYYTHVTLKKKSQNS